MALITVLKFSEPYIQRRRHPPSFCRNTLARLPPPGLGDPRPRCTRSQTSHRSRHIGKGGISPSALRQQPESAALSTGLEDQQPTKSRLPQVVTFLGGSTAVAAATPMSHDESSRDSSIPASAEAPPSLRNAPPDAVLGSTARMVPSVEPTAVASSIAPSSETINPSPTPSKRPASGVRNIATGVASGGSPHSPTSDSPTRRTPSSGPGTMVEAMISALQNSADASHGSANDLGTLNLVTAPKTLYDATLHTQARSLYAQIVRGAHCTETAAARHDPPVATARWSDSSGGKPR